MSVGNNGTWKVKQCDLDCTDCCDVSTLQSSSAFFVVPDKDCDIAVEKLRTCLVKVCQTLSIGHAHNAKTIHCKNNLVVLTAELLP